MLNLRWMNEEGLREKISQARAQMVEHEKNGQRTLAELKLRDLREYERELTRKQREREKAKRVQRE